MKPSAPTFMNRALCSLPKALTLLLIPVGLNAQPPTAGWAPPCALSAADSGWAADALVGWYRQRARGLLVPPRAVPTLVLFDETCAHTIVPTIGRRSPVRPGVTTLVAGDRYLEVVSIEHGGSVPLPDGTRIPAELTSFAAPDGSGGISFVMALPAIWRAARPGPDSDLLATVVFLHEFTHTQTGSLAARIDTLLQAGLPEDATDDVIQDRFAGRSGFREAYEAERDLLFRAAAEPTDVGAARVATSALALIDRRRASHFAGTDSVYGSAEDVFLTLEGTAQWAAYLWLTDPEGAGMPPAEALAFVRRDGRRWSQDEGLALALVLARLVPRWSVRVFADDPVTFLPLLRGAVAP
jgi:hypothetical protein